MLVYTVGTFDLLHVGHLALLEQCRAFGDRVVLGVASQVTEHARVVTPWTATYSPRTLVGKFLIGWGEMPLINVGRIEDGKIAEIWNPRHDIDTSQTLRFTVKGFLFGPLFALVPLVWALKLRRRLQESARV